MPGRSGRRGGAGRVAAHAPVASGLPEADDEFDELDDDLADADAVDRVEDPEEDEEDDDEPYAGRLGGEGDRARALVGSA